MFGQCELLYMLTAFLSLLYAVVVNAWQWIMALLLLMVSAKAVIDVPPAIC